ncbi:MAG: ferritin-like domain-containing protein [Methylococcales bacterium]|nr:ferritin-like domain-containing protein [Methylococcales bacterium]
MPNIFQFAETALHGSSCEQLLALTHEAQQLALNNKLHFESVTSAQSIENVQFPEHPILLSPREMPKRKLGTPAGLAAFFHAIAHVEFVAIYLAWDIVYRFRDLPEEFYRDWLRVADEEAQHFELLRAKLKTFGVDYGELPAHSGLWDLAQETAHDILVRLALVPRCMEAHGLDVTPPLIEKFKQLGDDDAVAILTRILTDEVGHVVLGSKWFKVLCNQQNLDVESQYQTLLLTYYKGGALKGGFNRELRLIAGFSETELDWLAAHSH